MDQARKGAILLAVVALGQGCGGDRPAGGVEIQSLGYNVGRGVMRVEVKVIDPESGLPLSTLNEGDFTVVLGEEHIHPKVVPGFSAYSLEFPTARLAAIPSFTVEASTPSRTLTGDYLTPMWAAQYAFSLIVYSMFALSAMVVAKFSYLAARRYRMVGGYRAPESRKPSSPETRGRAEDPANPSNNPAQISVWLRSIEEGGPTIVRHITTSSILGREDCNFQLPFVKIDGRGLDKAHAEIHLEGASAYVRNLAGTGVKVDGTPVQANRRTRLTDKCRLKLGFIDFEVSLEPGSQGQPHE